MRLNRRSAAGVCVAATILIHLPAGGSHAQAPSQVSAPPPAGQPALYVIQRGDELSIKVFGRSELDDTITVRPDGRISASLIDEIDAAGLTTVQLDEALTLRYARFFREPQVSVILRRAAGLKVFVGGEVGQPGVITITGDLTALAAVFQAGGFKRSARTDSVVLIRNHADAPVTQQLNLKDVGTTDAALMLQPHDVIFVPASRIAKVDNFVDQYIRQLIPISATAGFSYVLGNSFITAK